MNYKEIDILNVSSTCVARELPSCAQTEVQMMLKQNAKESDSVTL